ncbi:MAG: SDR family oxidoreductase [Tepidisphaeraceae bacterium]
MHILVTGGAGFIASHITHALVARGHRVRVLDNLSGAGSWRRLADLGDRVEQVTGDILNPRDIERAVEGVQVIFHLAAAVSVPESVARPLAYHDACATGTLSLLEAARRSHIDRFVYASTSAAYGESPEQPKVETMRTVPLSPYGIAKLTGEMYVTAYAHLHGMKSISLRYFNVFGPGQDPKSQYGAAVPSIVAKILREESPTIYGDGEQTRDFCFIDNVVHANLLAMSADVHGEAVNIGCGKRVSVNAIVSESNRLLGKNVRSSYAPPRPGDVRDSLADITLAKSVIGYEPQVYFEEGLARSLAWYQKEMTK